MDSNTDFIRRSLLGQADASPRNFTISELKDQWCTEFSSTPLSGRYMCWVIDAVGFECRDKLLNYLFETCTDPGAFATTAQMLSHGHLSIAHFNNQHISTLLEVVSDRERFHGLRGQALLVWALIAIDNPVALRQLRAYFFSIESNGDGRYLRYAAAAIGMIASHVHIQEAEEHLKLLKGVQDAAEEASVQLGFHYLARGLENSQRAGAIASFENARDEFRISASLGEGRLDAQLLSHCIEILLHFHNGVSTSAKETFKYFNNMAFEYAALLVDPETTGGLIGCRAEEAFRWMSFTSRISLLQGSFEEQTWLEAARIIEEQLYFTYCAQRSIFKRDNNGGIASVVQPSISERLQKNCFQLASVRSWLESVDNTARDGDWNNLYISLGQELEASIGRNPDAAAGLTSNPAAAEQGGGTIKFGREWLNSKFIESAAAFRQQLPTPAIAALKERLSTFLISCDGNDDFLHHKDAQHLFFFLVDRIFAFLTARKHDPSSKVNSKGYLNADFEETVKEEHLQKDLHEFLRTGIFPTNITYEPRKHAGGRSDILITYINVKTVIELKKIEKQMSDNEILATYGPQAATYQVADSNFCFLGVLDNFDTKGFQIDLRDSFSCHHWSPKTGKTRYSVMIFRVQGKRRPPSELSKKPKVNA